MASFIFSKTAAQQLLLALQILKYLPVVFSFPLSPTSENNQKPGKKKQERERAVLHLGLLPSCLQACIPFLLVPGEVRPPRHSKKKVHVAHHDAAARRGPLLDPTLASASLEQAWKTVQQDLQSGICSAFRQRQVGS